MWLIYAFPHILPLACMSLIPCTADETYTHGIQHKLFPYSIPAYSQRLVLVGKTPALRHGKALPHCQCLHLQGLYYQFYALLASPKSFATPIFTLKTALV